MSRRVDDDRLEVIHLQVSGELRRAATNDNRKRAKGLALEPIWVQVDARHLSPLLDELRQRRRRGTDPKSGAFPVGHTTRVLMAMKVGEAVDLPPITQGALTTCRTTARKHMGIPDARWHAETQPDGYVKVVRLPDGAAQIYGKPRNPAVAVLAAMPVDGRVILDLKGHLPAAMKHQARLAMDKAYPQWKTERLANGKLRVDRIR